MRVALAKLSGEQLISSSWDFFQGPKLDPKGILHTQKANKENIIFIDGISVKGLRFKLHGNNHGNYGKYYDNHHGNYHDNRCNHHGNHYSNQANPGNPGNHHSNHDNHGNHYGLMFSV